MIISKTLLTTTRNNPWTYKPGDQVAHSGVYIVKHMIGHFMTHDSICIEGTTFPECLHCGAHVVFELAHRFNYIHHEKFFDPLNGYFKDFT